MQEVGGSIPPGSTTLRPSGYAWRSHELPEERSVVPGEALLGEDGLDLPTDIVEHPTGFAGRAAADHVVRLHHPQH